MRMVMFRSAVLRLYGAALVGCIFALFVVAEAAAREAETVYVEGFPELRSTGGQLSDLFFGDRVRSGETVITGRADSAELELDDGNSVVVQQDTVFTLQEIDEDGESRPAYSNSRGAVTYRIDAIRGRNPRIQSANAVVGVRGTTFTVFAGDDGSSLFLVEEGRIAVQARGEEVELGPDFAVEVRAGEAPGEPFEVLRGEIDFSGWNNGRTAAILENPVTAAEGAYRRLEELVAEMHAAVDAWEPVSAELREARARASEIFQEEGQEAANEFREENVRPLERIAPRRYLNVRYWALSALNMRRYVFGRMYTILRSSYFMEPQHPDFLAYREVHERALDLIGSEVADYLVTADY